MGGGGGNVSTREADARWCFPQGTPEFLRWIVAATVRCGVKIGGTDSLAIKMNDDRIEESAGMLANTILLGRKLRVRFGSTVKKLQRCV